MEEVIASSTVSTEYFDRDGKRFWPCWCGVHRGEYGLNEWLQHHCLHRSPLIMLGEPNTGQLICVGCGMVFQSERP